jgi:hypothetical protein
MKFASASEFLPEDPISLYLLEAVEDCRGALEGMEELLTQVVKNVPTLEESAIHTLAGSVRRIMERRLVEMEKLAYLGEK